LAANLGQVGFHVVSDALVPKWEKINPVEGMKKIFSWKSVFETLKGSIKIGITGLIVYLTLKPAINRILSLPGGGTGSIMELTVESGLAILFRVLVVMVVVAIADYAFQFWQNEKKMRMTLREVRDELKETEGDPQIKQRIRNIQREMAARRMMDDVKKSSVVVTNPTTLAIALKYSSELAAPTVMAMGKNKLAERIRETAREHNVPVVENKPLAWALYKACEIGDAVPVHLYKAVAQILAYVYSLKGSGPV
jgi:flagellar biosynthetic protein FlhB